MSAIDFQKMFQPVIESMNFELIGVEFLEYNKGALLRIYIDGEQGINVDNCADVSRQLSAILDVEDPIQCEYTLEVSSPGMDRPLFSLAHFQQFLGHEVKVVLLRALSDSNRKRFRGVIKQAIAQDDQELIEIEMDNEIYQIPLDSIKKANLVPKF